MISWRAVLQSQLVIRFIRSIDPFAWGSEAAIRQRIQAHLDAGASHVCIEPLHPDEQPLPDYDALKVLADSQSPVPGRGGDKDNPRRSADSADVEREIAELVDGSTRDLRLAWRQLHRTDPPSGLSRDLLIRALAHHLQERSYGGASGALKRRLKTLSAEGASYSDSKIVLTTGTTLLRQWRGHAHTVLVREDGFEYDGQRYRSLTVIAEKITGAHWSGPRFFGLTKRARASFPEASR